MLRIEERVVLVITSGQLPTQQEQMLVHMMNKP